MLVQLPRRLSTQARQNGSGDAFEDALRRDLARAPVVACGAVVGGWTKRCFDLALVIATLPVWLLMILGGAAWAKLRWREPAFIAEERIGYGGRPFRRHFLRTRAPLVVAHPPPAEGSAATETRVERTRGLIERSPQLINVLRGEMSLVGPAPLTLEQAEQLNKSAQRYYLSARPGLAGVDAVIDDEEDPANQYKAYARTWSFLADAMFLWDAISPSSGPSD